MFIVDQREIFSRDDCAEIESMMTTNSIALIVLNLNALSVVMKIIIRGHWADR